MAVTWTVSSMDRTIKLDDKDDVVTTIHWRASETDSDGNSGSSYGSVSVTLGSQSFIAYKDIKESDAISWAKAALGSDEVTAIEASIASQIAEAKTPTTASGVSW
jgi:D-serine dehydratase